MNVMFVSQCSGRALTETRRVLDQYAERRGERSWHTPVTMEGLKTIHKLLRKTARKNSAIACYRIRRDRNELTWIVGNAQSFNSRGATPTNWTEQDLIRSRDEDDWHHGVVIRLLAAMAALFHDFGKANYLFQQKLRKDSNQAISDPYRHEWVSLRLFVSLIGDVNDDRSWLQRFAENESNLANWEERIQRDGLDRQSSTAPLVKLPPIAQAVGWLILTHHRLPTPPDKRVLRSSTLVHVEKHISADWCFPDKSDTTDKNNRRVCQCWDFKEGIPIDSRDWQRYVAKVAREFLHLDHQLLERNWLEEPQVLHVARLALILADHHYSSQPSSHKFGDSKYPLYANTDFEGQLKQRLDEHLIGVEESASKIVRTLPRLVGSLPRIARHRGFRQRTLIPQFRWQNRASDLAEGIRTRSVASGFFGVNMASTGTGKTLANGRILYGLADQHLGARFTLALGLRSLTLQTGDAYRKRLHLDVDDLAVLVGGGSVQELHENAKPRPAVPGSESSQELLPEQTHVHHEGNLENGPLKNWLKQQQNALLNAPVVVCTVDHLMPATEATRGGKQILPMLRLLTSDLVLDEVDDFDTNDLYAVSRLVYWAGLLGSRVLLSSATIPPAIARGLFQAYSSGRKAFRRSRGDVPIPASQDPAICCAWFDEFTCQTQSCKDDKEFSSSHDQFVGKRIPKLKEQPNRRCAQIIQLHSTEKEDPIDTIADSLYETMHEMHRNNALLDPITGKNLSIGLIRMANIDPLVQTATKLINRSPKTGFELHLCVYHRQYPLLIRHQLEQRLDRILRRDNNEPNKLFELAEIRNLLDTPSCSEQNVMLVVIASPVAEVGRDHDYDWAIVEPSSMRSIIQLAGRVRRHRLEEWNAHNVALLNMNRRALAGKRPAFIYPGYERKKRFELNTHELQSLLRDEELQKIDATSRIRTSRKSDATGRLSDLEHEVLSHLMLGSESQTQSRDSIHTWWKSKAHLTGVLQKSHPFRAGSPTLDYWLLPESHENSPLVLHRREKNSMHGPTKNDRLINRVTPSVAEHCHWWVEEDDRDVLEKYATKTNLDIRQCALRYMTLQLRTKNGYERRWDYHPAMGFSNSRV